MTESPRKNVPGVRTEPASVCLPGRTRIQPSKRARPQRHLKAWNKWGLSPQKHLQNKHSGKFETLIALQNDPRWLLLHSWFSKFPRGVAPGPAYKKRYTGKFWISLFYPTSAPRRHPLPPPIIILMQNTLLFAGHLPMIIYDFVIRLVLFVACEQNYLSRPLFLLYLYFCFCLDMVTVI